MMTKQNELYIFSDEFLKNSEYEYIIYSYGVGFTKKKDKKNELEQKMS